MKTLQLALGSRSYPIHIGAGLLGRGDLLAPAIAARQVLVVTNETVAPLYLDTVLRLLDGYQCHTCILPDGERYKTLDTVSTLFDTMLEHRLDRRATVIALGGGVVGDMAGFAAACYQRGVPYVQIPTTLLAQVDSSVGGKTGVNHPLGKNMIGAFHQPGCVLIDTDTLRTLDQRELAAGLAEVIKYGLIRDPAFFEWLEENMPRLLAREPEALAYAIERSCLNKAEVVSADEREAGQRALLNLGHTFGHAIETGVGYGVWLHGEAVGTGMLMAADLSGRMGWLSAQDIHRIENLIDRAQLPTRAPTQLDCARFLELMAVDKKVQDARLRLVLLQGIGKAVIADQIDEALICETITAHRALPA